MNRLNFLKPYWDKFVELTFPVINWFATHYLLIWIFGAVCVAILEFTRIKHIVEELSEKFKFWKLFNLFVCITLSWITFLIILYRKLKYKDND